MREVRIHLTDHVSICLQGQSDTIDIRASEPAATNAVQHQHAAIVAQREVVSQLAGAIRRAIVDDENPQVRNVEKSLNELGQVFPLVVGREDDQGPHAMVRATPLPRE